MFLNVLKSIHARQLLRPLTFIGAAAVCVSVVMTVPAAAQSEDANRVVAVVNGEDILYSDVMAARTRLPQQYQSLPVEQIFKPLLNSLIDSRLLAAEARSSGLEQDADIKRQLAGVTNQVLERSFIDRALKKAITRDRVHKQYEAMVKGWKGDDEVRASHILMKTEAEAKTVIADLAKGVDFAKLAKERSTGPSGASGGDLGFFTANKMVPAFSKAAFALKKGEVTQAGVKTQFGWHIIKAVDRRTTQPPALSAAEPKIREQLSRDIVVEIVEGLRRAAKIELKEAKTP